MLKYNNNWGLETEEPLLETDVYETQCLSGIAVFGYQGYDTYDEHILVYKSSLDTSEILDKYIGLYESFVDFRLLEGAAFSVTINGEEYNFRVYEPDDWYQENSGKQKDERSIVEILIKEQTCMRVIVYVEEAESRCCDTVAYKVNKSP